MAKDQVQITFKVFNEEFKKAMSEMRESTTRLNREFRLQKEQMKLTGSESDKLKAQVGYLNERYKQAQDRVKATEEQLAKAKKVYGENSEEVRKLEDDLMNAQIQEQKFANQLQVASQELKEAESKALQFSKSLREIGGGMQEAGKKISDTGQKLTTRLTLPIVGVGTAAAKMSTDFNKEMASVATMIPGENQRLLQLKGDIQDVAIVTGKSTADIAQGTYGVISAFGDAEDTMEKVEINAKAAAAGLATTNDALDLSSAMMKGYGDTTSKTNEKVMDLAFETLRLGQTSFPELASAMPKVIPTSNELGLSMEELNAVFATATGVTGNASEVSTQHQGVLKALMAPTKDMTKLMKELGVESGQAMIEQYGYIGAVEKVVEASKKTGQPLQKYIGSIQGQVLALALAGEQNDVYKEKLGQLENATGAMDRAFKEQTEGINATGFTFEQAMVKMQVAGQKFGDAMGPMLAKIADLISNWADKLNELTPAQMDNIIKIGAMVAAIGPLLMIIGKIVSILGGLFTVVGTVSGAIGVMTTGAAAATPAIGGLASIFSFLTGPVGIAIAIVSAFAGLAYVVHKNWDSVSGWLKDTWSSVADFGQSVWGGFSEFFVDLWSSISEFFTNIWTGISDTATVIWTGIADFFVTLWTGISEFFTTIWEGIKTIFTVAFLAIQFIVETGMTIITTIIRVPLELIKWLFETTWAIIGDAVMEHLTKIANFFTAIWTGIVDFFTGILNFIKGKITEQIMWEDSAWNKLKDNITAIWNAIKNTITTIVNAIKDVITTVWNGIKTTTETVWNAIKSTTQTIWDGIKSVITTVINAIMSVVGAVTRTIQSIVTTAWNGVRNITSTAWNAIKTAITVPFNAAKSAIANILNSIKSVMSNIFGGIRSSTTSTFNSVGNAMTRPVNAAKNAIQSALNAIKGFFSNLKLKFPDIKPPKLPRFSLEGKFSLAPPSVPKVGVKWYSEGAIFRRPTILSGIGVGDAYRGMGRGAEVVAPISKLTDIIADVMPIQEAQPAVATTINFYGNYSFRDQDDIDYFLNQAELKAKRREV